MKNYQIAIVEDHEYTNQLLVKMLSRHFKIDCLPFTNADTFTDWFNSHIESGDRTIYLLDIILSENPMAKNGMDLAHEVANSAEPVSIIILTGCPLNEEIRGKIKILQSRHISISIFEKPVDPDKLLKQIENIMGNDSAPEVSHENASVLETGTEHRA